MRWAVVALEKSPEFFMSCLVSRPSLELRACTVLLLLLQLSSVKETVAYQKENPSGIVELLLYS